jgi:hypothetical protein
VAGLGAVLGLEGSLVDGEHRLLKPRPAPFGALMRASVITFGAKRRAVLWSQPGRSQQRRSRLIDGPVDAS